MAALQKLQQWGMGGPTSNGFGPVDVTASDQFPAGLRVLVVDDDIICLRIIEQILHRCLYQVTTCSEATVALNLLRERKDCFDVVLSDVHMPDMDGFKLLELIGLEMDLPVIMISADGRTNLVMRSIRHGACDYLIKPIREEELKNIWQHVLRKKWNENKEHEHSGSLDDNDRNRRGSDDAEYASSVNEGTEGTLKSQKKRRDVKEEDDCELENDDPSASKKPRVVWSVELHQQFVAAVNQLGIDKAVPKRILELMNVPGLTRENVASHLQKFRLYLKRLSGVAQQQGGIPTSFCGSAEQNSNIVSYGRFDIQALASSGQIPPQTLVALDAELLGRPTLQLSSQVSSGISVNHGAAYGQTLIKSPTNVPKQFQSYPQPVLSNEDVHLGFGALSSHTLDMISHGSNVGGLSLQNGNILMGMLPSLQKQSILPEPGHSINVQPSCLVVPTHLTSSFQAGNISSSSDNQTNSFVRSSSVIDYGLPVPQSNSPSLSVCQLSSMLSSCWVNSGNGTVHNLSGNSGSFSKPNSVPDHGLVRSIGFVGNVSSFPSRFGVSELESTLSNLTPGNPYGESKETKVKQEPNVGFAEHAKAGIPRTQHFSPNDLMSVVSE